MDIRLLLPLHFSGPGSHTFRLQQWQEPPVSPFIPVFSIALSFDRISHLPTEIVPIWLNDQQQLSKLVVYFIHMFKQLLFSEISRGVMVWVILKYPILKKKEISHLMWMISCCISLTTKKDTKCPPNAISSWPIQILLLCCKISVIHIRRRPNITQRLYVF